MSDFSNNLLTLRERKGISRKELAGILGVTVQTYGAYENGKREPNLDKLIKIAAALHVSIDDLLGYKVDQVDYWANIIRPTGFILKNTTANYDDLLVTFHDEEIAINKILFNETMRDFINLFSKSIKDTEENIKRSFFAALLRVTPKAKNISDNFFANCLAFAMGVTPTLEITQYFIKWLNSTHTESSMSDLKKYLVTQCPANKKKSPQQ